MISFMIFLILFVSQLLAGYMIINFKPTHLQRNTLRKASITFNMFSIIALGCLSLSSATIYELKYALVALTVISLSNYKIHF